MSNSNFRLFFLSPALLVFGALSYLSVPALAGPAAAQPPVLEAVLSRAENSALGFWLQNIYEDVRVLAHKISPPKPRRVLLYSGQFDPFHNSHRAELLGVLNSGDFDLAVVAPSLKMIGLPADAQSPYWLRMLIAEKEVQDIPRAKVSSFILRRGIYGAPAAVKELRRQLGPTAELSMLMGSDNFKNIKSWNDVPALLSSANLLVNVRAGDNLGRLPLSALPDGLGDYYRMEAPGFFKNPSTGRSIQFISVPTDEISSLQTLFAAMSRDRDKLKTMFNPDALALVENYYYPFVPKELNSLRFQVATKSHESFKRIFGIEAGDLLVRDWRVALALACQPEADPESVAHMSGLVYRAALDWPCGVGCYPRLYAQAVRLGYDEEFAHVRRMAQTESGGELCSSHKYAPVPDAPAPLWKRLGRSGAKEAEYRPVFGPGEKVKVYLPLKSGEKVEALSRGVLSPCVRANGAKFCSEKTGEVPALVAEHLAGGANDVFVSATLSPAVAKRLAGPDGEVRAASVPAETLVFPSDPVFWPGSRAGNPKAPDSEVLTRTMPPQWLEPVAAGK